MNLTIASANKSSDVELDSLRIVLTQPKNLRLEVDNTTDSKTRWGVLTTSLNIQAFLHVSEFIGYLYMNPTLNVFL